MSDVVWLAIGFFLGVAVGIFVGVDLTMNMFRRR
jgi:hypothetical protein